MPINRQNVENIRNAIAAGSTTGNFAPSVFVIEPTSRCNLRCVMCPNSRMSPNNFGEISLTDFAKAIELISPYAEFLMLYWMGEPTLHRQFPDLLRIAREGTSARIVVSSNMTLLPDNIADAILQNCDILLCSIDRHDKSSYEKIRAGASYEAVVSNIEKILIYHKQKSSRCEIVVKALDINMTEAEYLHFCAKWSNLNAKVMLAWLNDWAGSLPRLRSVAKLGIPRESSQRTHCADLWFKMVVNWRGEVQLCCFDWNYEYTIGSLLGSNKSLIDLWQSEPIIKYREIQLNRQYDSLSICARCTTWGEEAEHNAYVDWTEESYFIVF